MDYVSTPFFHLVSSQLLLTFLRAAARRFAAISSAQRLQCPSMVLYSIRHLRHLDHYPKAKPNRAKKTLVSDRFRVQKLQEYQGIQTCHESEDLKSLTDPNSHSNQVFRVASLPALLQQPARWIGAPIHQRR